MKKSIGGLLLLVLGLVGMAWVYSMRPLSMGETVTQFGRTGAFGRSYIGSPAYEVLLVLAGLSTVIGVFLIYMGRSTGSKSTK